MCEKTCGQCDHKSGAAQLKDRMGQHFVSKCYCDFCYNVIYNSLPTGLLSEADQIEKLGLCGVRMNFTLEDARETKELLDVFATVYKRKEKKPEKMYSFTKGHFKRGVE